MATLQELYGLAFGAPTLRQRMISARLKAAWDIQNEATNTANHAHRKVWSDRVLADTEYRADAEYLLFLSNATIQTNGGASTDSDIQFVVNSFTNRFADDAVAADPVV